MPAKAPPRGPQVQKALLQLGQRIHAHRKSLKLSAVGVAESAGISRTTLSRIEKGEPSVTMGAYLNVVMALGLELNLNGERGVSKLNLDSKIKISDYPQLKKLAWQIKKTKEMSPKEVLSIYERNWRHINLSEMEPGEQELIKNILHLFGKEKLLV